MQSNIDRRKALTTMGLAGAVALVTPASVVAANEPSELAALIRRYRAEIDAWEAKDKTDEEFQADTPFDATMQQMIGVPARTRDDALAAFQFIRDEFELEDTYGDYLADALTSLLDAVDGYIVSTGRVA
jgi:phytoene dehydrogenase-like protein